MSKVILSNRILMPVRGTDDIQDKLTYVFKQGMSHTITYKDYRIIGNILSIPLGRQDLIPENSTIIDNRSFIKANYSTPSITLFPGQQEVLGLINSNYIINAQPSWGKTYTAIAICAKLGLKALVITGNTVLRDQWGKDVQTILGFKPSVIGSGQFTYDKPITVSNIQTLQKKERIKEVANKFGIIIVDEVHDIGAKTFYDTVDRFTAGVRLGLSATLVRRDGREALIANYIGTDIITPKVHNERPIKEVLVVDTNFKLVSNPMIPWAKSINKIILTDEYVDLLTKITKSMSELGHNTLVVSDRVDTLNRAASYFEESISVTNNCPIELRNSLSNLLETKVIHTIFGSISIFKQGINIPCLSCLVLGTAISGKNIGMLEQLMGRITRPYKNKPDPVLVDIKLGGATGDSQFRSRLGLYRKKGYKVTYL